LKRSPPILELGQIVDGKIFVTTVNQGRPYTELAKLDNYAFFFPPPTPTPPPLNTNNGSRVSIMNMIR